MSLVREQNIFLKHVSQLIRKAQQMGYVVTGGELHRTPEQQALHIQSGRSKTMNSMHLQRLAVDLNFFVDEPGGNLRLTYDAADIRPLGDFWESLDSANRWGGNWSSFKDTPHFERRLGGPHRQHDGHIASAVGPGCPNRPEDVNTVQRLLNRSAEGGRFEVPGGRLKQDGLFGPKTLAAIQGFQRSMLKAPHADGQVEPGSETLLALRGAPS